MTGFKIGAAALGLMIGVLAAAPASAWKRGPVQVLAVLPDVTPGVKSSVEGLTVGPDGNIYVPTFGFNTTGAIQRQRRAFRDLAEREDCQAGHHPGSSPHMLGLAFNPMNGFLLVLTSGPVWSCTWTRSSGASIGFHDHPSRVQPRPQRAHLRQERQRLRVRFLQRSHLEDRAYTAASRPRGSPIPLLGPREPVSLRRSGQTASSSATTAKPYSSPTPRFIRSSRSR